MGKCADDSQMMQGHEMTLEVMQDADMQVEGLHLRMGANFLKDIEHSNDDAVDSKKAGASKEVVPLLEARGHAAQGHDNKAPRRRWGDTDSEDEDVLENPSDLPFNEPHDSGRCL